MVPVRCLVDCLSNTQAQNGRDHPIVTGHAQEESAKVNIVTLLGNDVMHNKKWEGLRRKMSRFISLPSISEPSNKRGSGVEERRSNRTSSHPTFQELVARESLKKVSGWFESWRDWQRRVFICQAMEQSSRRQLRLLATVLEPVLHIDFSSSLVPHLASLHVDGSATFQVQRGVLRRVLCESESQMISTCPRLPSLPTTLASSETDGETATSEKTREGGGAGKVEEDESGILRPALPLTHPQHALISQNSSLEELRRTRFSSVPDFQSTTNLLRDIKRKDLFRPRRHHRRSQSLGSCRVTKSRANRHQKQQEAEKFKTQLVSVSEWMLVWPAKQKSQLLLELVKLCNKELLAYFVQCLYQRLQEEIGIDSLSDSLLLKIFSYLDPVTLCRCAQVCQRWRNISNLAQLWEGHCRELGRREGVGDLVTSVRGVCEQREGGVVDWKFAYKELSSVIAQIRQLVLNAVAEKEEREREMEERKAAACMTKAALRARLSLREMIDLARANAHAPLSTIQEVLGSAPESPTTIRRRQRRERKAMEEERLREESERALSSRYQHRRPYDRSTPSSRMEGLISMAEEESRRSVHHPHRSTLPDIIELIQEAQDRRSGLLYLPNPDGVRCLVLAGCLLAEQHHRPGKTAPIPRLRRLPPLYSTVLCLQCDQRKIVCGTQNREIDIFDIRSGRHVNTLTGHKGSIQCLQFDDNKIVSGSWDSTCIVWDVVHGSVIHKLMGHTGCVSCLQFCGEKLVTGSLDKSLRVWSTTTWECIAIISQAHNGPVTCVAFDGSIIASGAHDRCVKLWSPTTYRLLATLPHPTPLTSLLLSKLLLVSACQSGSLKLWSLTPYYIPPNSPSTRVPSSEGASPQESLVTQWQLEDNVYLTHMVLEGDKIFACGSGCVIYEWDIATGTFTRSLTGHTRPLTCLSVTESKIVSAAEDHTVCIWYYKKTKNMYKAGTAELLMEESDPTFPDIPIRVITA